MCILTTIQWLINISLSGFIVSLNKGFSNISANDFGTVVDLSNYAQGQIYTFPSDGYLSVYQQNGRTIYRLYGAKSSSFIYCVCESTGEHSNVTFVRKGMRVEVRGKTGSGSVAFVPLA